MKKITLTKRKKLAIIISATVVCGGGIFTYTMMQNKAQNAAVRNASMFETYYVPDAEKVFIGGKLVPYNSKEFLVSPELGVVDNINVKDGDIIKKGELLYSTKNPQILSQIDEINDEISIKRKEYKSAEDESMKKSINLEISNMQDKVKKLKEKVYTCFYAPFEGKVYLNDSENSVLTLESLDFYVKGATNEYDMFKLTEGQQLDVKVYATKEEYKGKISHIGDRPLENGSSDGSSPLSQYEINIELEQQENLKNGLNVQGVAIYKEENLKIPTNTLVKEGENNYVYKVVNDVISKVQVKISEETPEYAVVNEGVSQGDNLVKYANNMSLTDGQSINDIMQGGF